MHRFVRAVFLAALVWFGCNDAWACAEGDAFIARTTGFGPNRTAAYKALICGLVTDGVWAKLGALYLFASLDTTNAVLNLVSTNFTVISNGSPTFTADRGYTGVAGSATVNLDTGFSPSSAPSARHLGFWSFTNEANAFRSMGANGGFNDYIYPRFVDDAVYGALGNDSSRAVGPSTDSLGHYVVNRSNLTTVTLYKNGGVVNSNASAPDQGLPSGTVKLLSFGGTGDDRQTAAAHFGGSLTPTDVTNFYNRLNTYMALLPFGPDASRAGSKALLGIGK